MYVILMGAQGSGKGTQADRVAPQLHLVKIATGELFRAAIASGSAVGREVQAVYDRGELVPDALTLRLVEERLREIAQRERLGTGIRGALFDGFPRTLPQAEGLDALLAAQGERVTAVIVLEVPRDVLIERLSGRLVCKECGATYHVTLNPPKVPGVCDACGGELIQRADDTPAAVKKRLDIYFSQTAPLLDYYRERGLLAEVDGDRPIEVVTEEIITAVARIGGATQGS